MSAPLPPPTPYPPQSAAVRARSLATRILWTLLPFGTLGLGAWGPALHVARRRRTPASWWWVAGLAAGAVGEVVGVSVVPSSDQGNPKFIVGMVIFGNLITGTIYAWRGCGPDLPRLRPEPGPYPGYGAAWTPSAPTYTRGFPAPQPAPTQPYPAAPATPAPTIPPVPTAAAQDMAAEVQAELRELRGFLGGEDAR